ncbi:MAG: CCA tRNA nucleotidyltransferase [Rickettsiales bacterium]
MSKQPDWLKEAALQQFFAATKAAGGEARAVGGAVRDWLMGIDGADVDVASTLVPERTMEIAVEQGWKAIPTGIAYGTVTLVLPTRILEVTTLRKDVETDGRHATVAFTDDWKEDAARRDFTINAMSMDAEGNLTDFLGGQEDLKAHAIRFIGDAGTRITEDALRMLRYFRFLATHGRPPADVAALETIAEKKDMVAQLSGERIANEMKKLLSAENPGYALRLFKQAGLAPLVFGREIDPSIIIRLHMLESQADYQVSVWARVLAVLPNISEKDVQFIAERWKISRYEAQQLKLLASLPTFDAAAPKHVHTRLLRLHGAPAYLDWLLLQAATGQGVDVMPFVELAAQFVPPVFPVSAMDLLARGMKEGKALGDRLSQLETAWEESDYALTKEALLEY